MVGDEAAVGGNPRHPDCVGLELAMQAPIGEKGAAMAAGFKVWIIVHRREQASAYKHRGLWKKVVRHIFTHEDGSEQGHGCGCGNPKEPKTHGDGVAIEIP